LTVEGLRFQEVPGCGSAGTRPGLREQGFRLRVSGLRFRVSGFGVQVSVRD
jgi:hypothetical protein